MIAALKKKKIFIILFLLICLFVLVFIYFYFLLFFLSAKLNILHKTVEFFSEYRMVVVYE